MNTNTFDAADPFTAREGKTLSWRNVNMNLMKKGEDDRKLLSKVWGEVPEGDVTAIMGPSGSGKTSLLNILAGRTYAKGPLFVEADVYLDSFPVDPTRRSVQKQIAFVAQEDSLQATCTPREAIKFSAKLRLPRSMTEDQLDALTSKMLTELSLENCADTYLGGPLLKGCSGGQKKRASVGVELVTKPALVFLDEPTSGLDSYSAKELVKLLQKVAKAGSSVLVTIHQPASEVFNSFDSLIFLNQGRVMYQGGVEKIPLFFAKNGYALPTNHNPADWVMAVAQEQSVEDLEKAGFFESCTLADHVTDKVVDALEVSMNGIDPDKPERGVTIWTQIKLLYAREFRNIARDKVGMAIRLGITAFLNLLFGVIFLDVGRNSNDVAINVQSKFGAVVMLLISSMFGTAQSALMAIPEERPLFLREYATDHYSIFGYFLSKFTVEAAVTFLQVFVGNIISFYLIGIQANFFLFLSIIYALAMASSAVAVFLGCLVESPRMALELLPILFVPQMLFAGFFVALQLIPVWLRWIQYICSLGYGVRLGLIAEFGDCSEGTGIAADNCENALESGGADVDSVWWYWVMLVGLFVVIRVSAIVALKSRASF